MGSWGVATKGDTSAHEPYAAVLLDGAGSIITAGTCPGQERRGTAHPEEAEQVRARDPFFLEADDQRGAIQSAPGLKVGCGGPLRDCHQLIAKEIRSERGCGVLAEMGCIWPMPQLSSTPSQDRTSHPSLPTGTGTAPGLSTL